VVPANHDPLVPGSVWDHPAWRDKAARVHIARNAEPIVIGDADFLPSPLSRRSSAADPTDAFSTFTGERDRIRVGIAHGSLRGAGARDELIANDFPIDRAVVQRAQLDYLALGHWHTPSSHAVDGITRIAYCGSHEPTKFGETAESGSSGQCLLVTIDGPRCSPVLEPVRTQCLQWRQCEQELVGTEDLSSLRASIDREPSESKDAVLLDLLLTGTIAPSDVEAIDDLETLARARFLFARIRRDQLLLTPDDASWIDRLPPGVPQAVARRLLKGAGSEFEGRVAREAMHLLFRISQEKAQ
jgi:DNA repair exonuclease SbcCD nuclease subunit